jgi:hypothetical protein
MFKAVSIILLTGLLFEGGGYLYGLQPSDVIYYHVFFKQKYNDKENECLHLFENNLKKNQHPVFWLESGAEKNVTEPVNNKYQFSKVALSLNEELKKIPKNVIKENINKIYLLNKLVIDEINVGGTYDPSGRKIFIKIKSKSGNNLRGQITKSTFHHELSSILLKRYSFDESNWRNAFDNGFTYENDKDPFYHLIYLQGEAEKISQSELYKRGLLRQYAETGVENDFNIYASNIFTEPRKMKKLIDEYPVIKRKYEVFRKFYLGIDSGFAPIFNKIDG